MATFLGINFPFQKGATSMPEQVSDEELIKQSILQIILTPRQTRVMRPEFGSGVFNFVFDNNDELLVIAMQREVRTVIGRYEPRCIVTAVDVQLDKEKAEAIVTVSYVIPALATPQQVAVAVPI